MQELAHRTAPDQENQFGVPFLEDWSDDENQTTTGSINKVGKGAYYDDEASVPLIES